MNIIGVFCTRPIPLEKINQEKKRKKKKTFNEIKIHIHIPILLRVTTNNVLK